MKEAVGSNPATPDSVCPRQGGLPSKIPTLMLSQLISWENSGRRSFRMACSSCLGKTPERLNSRPRGPNPLAPRSG
jgi:hypothetical protein